MNVRLLTLALAVLTMTACSTYGSDYDGRRGSRYSDNHSTSYRNCSDCGVVTRIDRYRGSSPGSSGGGAVIGAVVGGVLGNQVGSGSGRTAATVAGAVVGGIAGDRIERNADRLDYDITVRMDEGNNLRLSQHNLNGIREGSRVRVSNGRARLE